MKNKNYVIEFINDNDLTIFTPFRTSASPNKWFCFTENYDLGLIGGDDYDHLCIHLESILMSLLKGEIEITQVLGK